MKRPCTGLSLKCPGRRFPRPIRETSIFCGARWSPVGWRGPRSGGSHSLSCPNLKLGMKWNGGRCGPLHHDQTKSRSCRPVRITVRGYRFVSGWDCSNLPSIHVALVSAIYTPLVLQPVFVVLRTSRDAYVWYRFPSVLGGRLHPWCVGAGVIYAPC